MTHSENQDHGNEVFVFIERLTPIEGREEDVLSIVQRSANLLRGQPGLLQSLVTRATKGREICSFGVWRTKADFQTFMKTDAVAALLESEDFSNIKSWMSDYNMMKAELVDGWHG